MWCVSPGSSIVRGAAGRYGPVAGPIEPFLAKKFLSHILALLEGHPPVAAFFIAAISCHLVLQAQALPRRLEINCHTLTE